MEMASIGEVGISQEELVAEHNSDKEVDLKLSFILLYSNLSLDL